MKNVATEINAKLLGFITLIMIVSWSLIFMYSIHIVLPPNPLKLPFENNLGLNAWFPQGWGFFTRDPRSVNDYVYNLDNDRSAVAWPNNSVRNLFGISRYGRAQGIELGLIESKIPESAWKTYNGNIEKYFKNTQVKLTVDNPTPHATISGKIGIVRKHPIPWSWSKQSKYINMPYKIVVVNVNVPKNR
ncbi:SdpA family antimicrobial peptide system protein [Sporolactobacillus shoreae]|uniref:SdpA family antimicrobial peptide system protein n=1 Tax=Sporolactobacillus shoreae TaxID=1465501 RepID=A0A4Z0GK10_9BACL|nr:SdpA family antimicrobial peptide system protein [Sporolactobacillus shoreae]TGA96349.1 SdpA family antimicrobial peptide system protein [Sporolactobacillus shoreae]